MKLSIIIVTYNSQHCIKQVLRSIIKTGYLTDIEIVIIDNASNDKTLQIITKEKLPRLQIFRNRTNIGLTKACNLAAKKIAKGEYLFFLNPDTVINDKNFFTKLFSFTSSKKDAGGIGVKVLNSDGSLQPSCGRFPTILTIIFDRLPFLNKEYGLQIRDRKFYTTVCTTDWVSANNLLIRKDLFRSVRGFDKDIFMYGEDFDLCYRLHKAGYKNYFCPKLSIYHQDTGSNNAFRKPHKYFSMRKGLSHFLSKHHTSLEYHTFLFLVKIESLFFLLLLPFRKYDSAKVKSLWRGYLLQTINL